MAGRTGRRFMVQERGGEKRFVSLTTAGQRRTAKSIDDLRGVLAAHREHVDQLTTEAAKELIKAGCLRDASLVLSSGGTLVESIERAVDILIRRLGVQEVQLPSRAAAPGHRARRAA